MTKRPSNHSKPPERWRNTTKRAQTKVPRIFYLSNPGDYPYDEDAYERPDFEIVEVSE